MTSRRQPSEPAATAAIEAGCRTLRLPTIRDRFAEIAAAAEREQLTYLGFLAELVMAECDDRTNRRAVRRVHAAGFPRPKRLEEFDFAANPAINPATIAPTRRRRLDPGRPAAVSDRGLRHRQNPPADRVGHRRRRTRLPGQVHARLDAGQRARRSRRRTPTVPHCHPLRPRRSAPARRTRLPATRPPRRRTAVPSPHRAGREEQHRDRLQRTFSGWTKTFTDPRLCAAIVDRLTFNGHIIETGTTSYRLAHARASRSAQTQ